MITILIIIYAIGFIVVLAMALQIIWIQESTTASRIEKIGKAFGYAFTSWLSFFFVLGRWLFWKQVRDRDRVDKKINGIFRN